MTRSDNIVEAIKRLEKQVENAGYFVVDKNRAAIQDVIKALREVTERLDSGTYAVCNNLT
jgi:hypothetical protein